MIYWIIIVLLVILFAYLTIRGYRNNNLVNNLVTEFKKRTFTSEQEKEKAKEELKLKLISIKQRTLSINLYWTMKAKEKIQDKINLL